MTPEERAQKVVNDFLVTRAWSFSVQDMEQAIAVAIRDAVAPWRALTDEALQIVDASAPLHPDRARNWEQKRCELRDRQSRLLGVGRAER